MTVKKPKDRYSYNRSRLIFRKREIPLSVWWLRPVYCEGSWILANAYERVYNFSYKLSKKNKQGVRVLTLPPKFEIEPGEYDIRYAECYNGWVLRRRENERIQES